MKVRLLLAAATLLAGCAGQAPMPQVPPPEDLPSEALKNNPVVKVADAMAKAKEFRARGERKQLYPSVDFVGQYAMLARFNNYDQFFQKFQRNNITAGVAIRFPIFNGVRPEIHPAECVRHRPRVVLAGRTLPGTPAWDLTRFPF